MSDHAIRPPQSHPECRLLRSIALALLLVISTIAQAQVTVDAIPDTFSAGARIRVNLTGLALNTGYRLSLEEDRPGVGQFDLQSFSSGTTTSLSREVAIPNAPPGDYEIVLYRVQLGSTRMADTPVTIAAAPVASLTPAQGAPGKRITYSVSNLVPGTLRVLYAGKIIVGPVAVGSSHTGRFVVPSDRPPTLPATVPVVFENLVGRLVVRRATVNFQALAPSIRPRLGVQQLQLPPGQLTPQSQLPVTARIADQFGGVPGGTQSLYFIGDGLTIPLDTQSSVGSDGTLQLEARSPGTALDGLSVGRDRPGRLMLVGRGRDLNSGAERSGQFEFDNGGPPNVTIDGGDGQLFTDFTVRVRGVQPGGGTALLEGAVVYAEARYQSAFLGFVNSGGVSSLDGPASSSSGLQIFQSSQANQFTDYAFPNRIINTEQNFGCPNTLYRKRTTAQGTARFQVSREALLDVGAFQIDPCEAFPQNCRPGAPTTPAEPNGFTTSASFLMRIAGTHIGYRNAALAIEFDADSGRFRNGGTFELLPNNTIEIILDRSQATDFSLPFSLRIDGVGPPDRRPGCNENVDACFDSPLPFKTMTVFPDTAKWPNSVITTRNVGRRARLQYDSTVYGPLQFGRITLPGIAPSTFVASTTVPGCVLDVDPDVADGQVEYTATLPDMTRLAAGSLDGTVELRFPGQQLQTYPIRLFTETPGEVHVNNPNIASLSINALTGRSEGDYNVPDRDIPVASPGYGMGRLDNRQVNDGDFVLSRTADGLSQLTSHQASANDVAGFEGPTRPAGNQSYFGFTDGSHATPATQTLFDTGIIPLFRYPFGIPPLAQATFGADFWMAASLKYYGQLRAGGMNATIDPRVAGGVDIFFDLDVLLGLISASIRAESELGLEMRARVNAGGLAHLPGNPSPPAGECFTFDLDAVWEACAVGFCEGGREPVIREEEPGGCRNAPPFSTPIMLRGIETKEGSTNSPMLAGFDLPSPRYTASAIASDGRGRAISIGVDGDGDLVATHNLGAGVSTTRVIATNTVAVQHLDIAFYATNRAMAVWSENRLSVADVRNLIQSQRGRAFDDIARSQRLRFSHWDGRDWSAPAELTTVGSDGKPQLAGCTPSPRFIPTDSCPTGGEITVVWERDANQNLDAPDLEVWSARWRNDGRGWVNTQRVSATGASSDMLPSVAYRNGTPIVAWSRGPNGAFTNLHRRHIAYRFLDGGTQVDATALGDGVGWVDIGVAPNDDVVLAYTRAQDPLGFVGNRQALFSARATSCSNGSCSFQRTELRDPNGRQYRVERPRVAFDENNQAMIGFRALAFGPDSQGAYALPGDLPGITLGTGELAMVRINSFAQSTFTARIIGLSDNGLQHWKPDFVYDETIGGALAVSMQAPAPVLPSLPLDIAQKLSPEGSSIAPATSELADGGTLRMATGGPDFELRRVRLSRSVAAGGQSAQLNFDLVNVGGDFVVADGGSVAVVASLNGPAGSAPELARFTLSADVGSNFVRPTVMIVTFPSSVVSDELQTVFVDIVASEAANAMDSVADHDRIELNAMPIPGGLNALVRADTPFVHLTWDAPTDTRVHGWRIWKLLDDGQWAHLGSTRRPGYVDLTAEFAIPQTYRVASYSANGMESEPSEPITGTAFQTRGNGIFGNGFEAGGP